MPLVQTVTQVQVDGSSATSFNLTVTSAGNGNTLVWLGAIFDLNETWTTGTFTDTGNTWTTREGEAAKTGQKTRSYVIWATGITGGTRTLTIPLTGTSGEGGRYVIYGCLEFSGLHTTAAEDTWDQNSNIDYTTNDVTAGPITTTDAGDVLVGAASLLSGDPTLNWASPTSWTNSYRENDTSDHENIDAGYWIPGSIQTTYSAQWTHDNTSGTRGCAVVVALKPAAPDQHNPFVKVLFKPA